MVRSLPQSESVREKYAWRLQATSGSPRFRRLCNAIDLVDRAGTPREGWSDVLKSIALIEMTERPRVLRACEWLASRALYRQREYTLGPFQLRNAPWNDVAAVRAATDKLADSGLSRSLDSWTNLKALARVWNGSSERANGSSLSYAEALSLARLVLSQPGREFGS